MDLKEQIISEFQRCYNIFKEEHPYTNTSMPRTFFLQKSSITRQQIDNIFGGYKYLKDVADIKRDHTIHRNEINKVGDDINLSTPRRYVVTALVAGAYINEAFISNLKAYCKAYQAKLILLPMRGPRIKDSFESTIIEEYKDCIYTEYSFSKNLKAQDFLINPQMINPLTGLNRFGQKEYSLIIASPKQFMRVVPVSNESFPHIIHSTGACTLPTYLSTRQGRLAEQDHCTGALIVEVQDSRIFHIRQIRTDSNNGFYDLSDYWSNQVACRKTASAIVLGDMHAGFEDPSAINAWKECIKETKPKFLIIHDLFDGHSISHHHKNNIERQVNRNSRIDTLEKELQNIGQTLSRWATEFSKQTIVIVPSNHDEFLQRYLQERRFIEDRINYKISLELSQWLLEKQNPIQQYIEKYFKLKTLVWLKREKDYLIHGVHIGAHGDKGYNGIRGGIQHAELAYSNSITGHSHSPQILRNAWVTGTSTKLLLDYNEGYTSTWLHASVLLYKEGLKQTIISIEGNWRVEKKKIES